MKFYDNIVDDLDLVTEISSFIKHKDLNLENFAEFKGVFINRIDFKYKKHGILLEKVDCSLK